MEKYKCPNGHTVEVTYKLKRMPTAKAGVNIYIDGRVELVSYETTVVSIDADGWLTCTGTYSATTRKHIGAFMKEWAPLLSYYDAKAAYEDNHRVNIHTGEVLPL